MHTFSGLSLISECRIWNRLFHIPKVLSTVTRVFLWALLNLSSALVAGRGYGVIRNGLQTYPESPIRNPFKGTVSICLPIDDSLKILLSWADPGQRATTLIRRAENTEDNFNE